MPTIAPHGSWRSKVDLDLVTGWQNGLGQVRIDRGRIYFCETRPSENGRVCLMVAEPDGSCRALTGPGFSVRTRIQEYGGRAIDACDGIVVLVCDSDQRLWRIEDDVFEPLTPDNGARLRFGEPLIDPHHRRVVAICEDHGVEGEPKTSLVAVPLAGGEPVVLAEGHDFFAAPALSPDGRRLAWITWDHPAMPWDATTLWAADIAGDGSIGAPVRIAGGSDESVLQPEFMADGRLVFVSDRSGWWNFHDAEGRALLPQEAEFAGPLWQLGMRWYAPIDATTLLAAYVRDGFWRLGRVDIEAGTLEPVDLPAADIGDVVVEGGVAAMRVASTTEPASILRLDLASGRQTTIRRAGELTLEPGWLSRPRPITFACGDRDAHAFFYPPTNPDFAAPAGEKPPLIVRSHGGPTAAASPALRLAWQYWTSRGFAVCDVNYGGSTGYGRDYRRRLDGQWGIVDVEDCIAAARHLVAAGEVDGERLVISGGSAGGYTTLCALTFHDTFKAGASSYGVGDLEALARDTHKFESRYLDGLVAPWPEGKDIYEARSPVRHAERVNCPVIFFQGLEDKVVPPNQTEAMVEALRAKGLPVAYLKFEGEGHGFRRAETQRVVLQAELAFYCRLFGIEPAEDLPPIDIANLD